MWAIFWRSLKDKRNMLIIYSLIGIIFLWMFVIIFPTIQEESASISELIKKYPPEIFQALNVTTLSFDTLEGYVAMENFSIMWPIMAVFFLIAIGASSIAGEIENGTIEILLSQPIARIQIFLGKWLAAISSLIVFIITTILVIIPIAIIQNVDYQLKGWLVLSLLAFIFSLAILHLSFFFSTLFSEKGKVYGITGLILGIMYFLNIIAALKDNLDNLKYLSFFYYFNYNNALMNYKIELLPILVFLGTAIVFLLLSLIRIHKRDVAI